MLNFDNLTKRDLTTRVYQVRLETLNEESRSIDAVIATDSPVAVLDWNRFEIIDEVLVMDGCILPDDRQVPMLDTHDRSTVQKQIGSTRNLRIEGNQLIGTNHYSKSQISAHAWDLTKEGHLRDNSIGYQVLNSVMVEPGESANINGRNYTANQTRALRVTTEWSVKENSVCAIGADSNAKNRNEYKELPNMNFEKWLQGRGIDINTLDEAKRSELEAEFKASQKNDKPEPQKAQRAEPETVPQPEPQRTEPAADPIAAAKAELANERKRVKAIRDMCRDFDVDSAIVDKCIDEGYSIERSQGEILNAIRSSRPNITPGSAPAIIINNNSVSRDIVSAALLMREGSENVVVSSKWSSGKGEDIAEQADKFRGMSLLDTCRHAIALDGMSSIPTSNNDIIRTAFSTTSLSGILSNVANKSMMKGYNTVQQSWREWCSVSSVPNFKAKTVYRLTDTGDLQKVENGGEVKKGGAVEESESYSIATYAKNFGLTRQNMLDDDLGAFTRIPQQMGAKGANLPGDLVYAHLIANGNMSDNVALFHATHANLNTNAALAKATLSTAITKLRTQKDKDGRTLNIMPKILLVPVALTNTAIELTTSYFMVGSTSQPNVNALSGYGLKTVSDPRLDTAATTWYLTGDPAVVDTIEVSFLNGIQTPTIERFPMGPDYMGITFRAFFDCGCKAIDFRGMQKNTA